ncbi:MAG: HAD family hydrolase [bacterium]
MRNIIVYDFDGTITTKDTFPLFIKFVKGTGGFLFIFLLFSPILVLMKLGLYEKDKAKEKMFAFVFKGVDYSLFKQWCLDFAPKHKCILRAKALSSIKEYSDQDNTTLYIISASIKDWIEPFFAKDDFKMIIATEIEVDSSGKLTGRFKSKNCNREQKIERLLAVEPNRKSYYLTVYGDSSGDKPLITFADKGVYVKEDSDFFMKKCQVHVNYWQ